MMKKSRNKKTVFAIAIGAMMSALAVVFMLIGSVLEIADLASAMAASFLVWFITIEFGLSHAVSAYAVISTVSFLFLPSKLPAFYFILLYGWYPILKLFLGRKIKKMWLRFAVKAVITVAAVLLEEWLARVVLGYVQTVYLTVMIIFASLLLYIPYDVLLARLAIIYGRKWRRYIFRH